MDAELAPRAAPAPRPGRWSRQVIGPFTLRHVVVLLAILVGVGLLLALLTSPIGAPAPSGPPRPGSGFYRLSDPTEGLAIGQVAPELAGTIEGRTVQLKDLDGNPIRLSDLRGRPVWINFWASWCPPCQEETPVLRQVYETHRDEGLVLVAVSVQETSADDVRRYATTYDLSYPIGFDATSAVFKAWRGFGLPTHYFIDRQGVIRDLHYGPLSVAEAERLLAPILRDPGRPRATSHPGVTNRP